jgi:DNA-binding transcriptional regulator YhcF (GntR family)
MIRVGNLVSTRGVMAVVAAVEAETTVSAYLLLEDENFLAALRNANDLEEIINWVNENY